MAGDLNAVETLSRSSGSEFFSDTDDDIDEDMTSQACEEQAIAVQLVCSGSTFMAQPTITADYSSFPTKSFAMAYLLANSLHPIVSIGPSCHTYTHARLKLTLLPNN